MAKATRAVDAIQKVLGVQAQLVKGSGGIFTVAVNGNIVAAKSGGVFPDEMQIVEKVREALG